MNAMKFCDLHTHVLPGADDGAPTMEYALQMLQNAVASDVSLLAVTPHWGGPCPTPTEDLRARFLLLQQAAQSLPVQLYLGAEVLADAHLLPQLSPGTLPTISGGRYLLTEFPVDADPAYFLETLQRLLDLGYIPLVAHPERYHAVCQQPQIVLPWLDMGCHLQLTGRSLLGEYGKNIQRTAAFLLQKDLVACIASDAHGLHRRSNFLLDVYDHLSVQYSKQYALCLMRENPTAICLNADL